MLINVSVMPEDGSQNSDQGWYATIFKGTIAMLLGSVAGRFLSLIGQAMIARSLSPSLFGKVGFMFTTLSVIGTLSLVGTPEGVSRFVSNPNRSSSKAILSGYFIAIVGAVATIIAILAFQEQFLTISQFDITLFPYNIAIIYVVTLPFQRITIGALRGYNHSTTVTLSRDIIPVLLSLAIFGAFWYSQKPLTGAVLYWSLIPLISGFISIGVLILSEGRYTISANLSLEQVSDLWRFSWPLAIGSVFTLMMSNIDIILLGILSSNANVGYYKTVQPIALASIMLLTSFVFMYFPVASEMYDESRLSNLSLLYESSSKILMVSSIPIFVPLIVFPNPVIQFLYSSEYLPGSLALQILLVGMFARVIVGPNGATIKAMNMTRIDLIASGAGFLTNVALNVLLIPEFGIFGAATSTAIGFIVFNLIECTIIYKNIDANPISAQGSAALVSSILFALFIRTYLVPESSFLQKYPILIVILTSILLIFVILLTLSLFGWSKEDYAFASIVDDMTSTDITKIMKKLEWRRR